MRVLVADPFYVDVVEGPYGTAMSMTSVTSIRHLVELSGVEWRGKEAEHEHGLIARAGIPGIGTWISDGPVWITVDRRISAPPRDQLQDRDDVIVASAHLDAGASAKGLEEPVLPALALSASAGLHAILIGAGGTLSDYDGAVLESDERYLIATWPIASAIDTHAWWLRSERGERFGAIWTFLAASSRPPAAYLNGPHPARQATASRSSRGAVVACRCAARRQGALRALRWSARRTSTRAAHLAPARRESERRAQQGVGLTPRSA